MRALLLLLLMAPTGAALADAADQIGVTAIRGAAWNDAQGIRHEGLDGRGVAVFMDEGYDGTHPALDHCVDPDRFAATLSIAPAPPLGPMGVARTDDSGHGVFIASVLCAQGDASGMAPASKVFAWTGFCASACPLEAWYLDERLHIYTSSVGGDPIQDAQRTGMAPDADILFFQAVGNSGGDGTTSMTDPELHDDPRLLGIAALDRTGAQVADYSSRGAKDDPTTWPDLSAPGCMIAHVPPPWVDYYVTSQTNRLNHQLTGATDCRTLSDQEVLEHAAAGRVQHKGTSFATPVAAGAAALMWQVHPELNATTAAYILTRTADPFLPTEDADGDGNVSAAEFHAQHGWQAGWGRMNATAAVAAAHLLSLDPSQDVDAAIACATTQWESGRVVSLNAAPGCQETEAIVERAQAAAPAAPSPTEPAQSERQETPMPLLATIVGLCGALLAARNRPMCPDLSKQDS